jgi:hypothetical protein
MSRSPDHVAAAGPPTSDDVARAESTPKAAPWWRHLGVIVALALLPMVSLYFCGFIAMVILLSDQRRDRYVRLGGVLLIGWWTFTCARNGVPPAFGLVLLAAAAAAYIVAARRQPDVAARARTVALAVVAGALALLNVVPWGMRSARFGKQEALRLAAEASSGRVRATHAQVAAARERIVQRPVYLVLLFEPNPATATTADGEPCFRRAEVHYVDGIDGSVDRVDLVDRLILANHSSLVAEAREKDGFCLPLPRGTRNDIVPIPAPAR